MLAIRIPAPKGGGRGGNTSPSTSSSSSGGGGGGMGSSPLSPGTAPMSSGFYFVSDGCGGGGFHTADGGFIPLWAFILVMFLCLMVLLFIAAFIVIYVQESKRRTRTDSTMRWVKVFWGATKIATFFWIPVLIYRLTCGRNHKKSSRGGFE